MNVESQVETALLTLCQHRSMQVICDGESIGTDEFVSARGGLPLLVNYASRLDAALGTTFTRGASIEVDDVAMMGTRVSLADDVNILPLVILLDSAIETGVWAATLSSTYVESDHAVFDLDIFKKLLENVPDAFPIPRGHAEPSVSATTPTGSPGPRPG